jgi:hypothetical protein
VLKKVIYLKCSKKTTGIKIILVVIQKKKGRWFIWC